MLPVDTLAREERRALAAQRADVCVSLDVETTTVATESAPRAGDRGKPIQPERDDPR